MIADGLHALHHSIKDVRENYQATKRNMQQGVDNLDSEIRETGKFTFVHERNLRKDLGKVQLFSTFENFTAKQKFPNSRMHLSAISVDKMSLSKQKKDAKMKLGLVGFNALHRTLTVRDRNPPCIW